MYDTSIREKLLAGKTGETIFFDLALEDLRRAADLFRPVYDQTSGAEVSRRCRRHSREDSLQRD